MGAYKVTKTFASTEGAFIEQEIVECGAGIAATAIEGGDSRFGPIPTPFGGILPRRAMNGLKR